MKPSPVATIPGAKTHTFGLGVRRMSALVWGIGTVLLGCGRLTAAQHSLIVANFNVQPEGPRTMDEVTVSFTMKNAGSTPVVVGKESGVFVGARYVASLVSRENRDFGYQFEGLTVQPGQELSFKDTLIVDSVGEWRFWPVVEIKGEFVAFEEHTKQLVVSKRLPLAQPPQSLGPGKTIVYHEGKAVTIQVFPADNPWNQDVSMLPVHSQSEQWISNIGRGTSLHPDFGSGLWEGRPIGIPFVVVGKSQPAFPAEFLYRDESDRGPYKVPLDALIEGGSDDDGDRHAISVDVEGMKLYELFAAVAQAGAWKAGSGAIFDLTSNKLRPSGWTSADAAGLPIFPGLARYEEVYEMGEINHALRFTAEKSQQGYIAPATHAAGVDTDLRPPMGMRVRLKASFDISPFPERTQVILRALKKYGMFLADNGGDWFISGAPHPGWKDRDIDPLRRIKGSQFEVVDTGKTVKASR